MDGKIVHTFDGSEKVCIGRVLYFNAPIPHHILRTALEMLAKRHEWNIDFKLNTIYGRGGIPVRTLCLLKDAEQYNKLLPRETTVITERYREWDELTEKEQRKVVRMQRKYERCYNSWTEMQLEMDAEDMTRVVEKKQVTCYDYPFPVIRFDSLTKNELFQIRDMDESLVDDERKVVYLRPMTYQYYTPSKGNLGNKIYCPQPRGLSFADRNQLQQQLYQQFKICNFWGSNNYPRIKMPKVELKGRTQFIILVEFAPHCNDGITAIGFYRDMSFIDSKRHEHRLRFQYWGR